MYRAPHECPICHGKLTITEVSCPSCGTRMQGSFEGCRFCSLSPEETSFLVTFLRSRGSIKDVERELGVSYPTVRAALDNLLRSLGLDGRGGEEQTAVQSSEDVASGTAPGETDAARPMTDEARAAARREILDLLARHRISADEASKRLKNV